VSEQDVEQSARERNSSFAPIAPIFLHGNSCRKYSVFHAVLACIPREEYLDLGASRVLDIEDTCNWVQLITSIISEHWKLSLNLHLFERSTMHARYLHYHCTSLVQCFSSDISRLAQRGDLLIRFDRIVRKSWTRAIESKRFSLNCAQRSRSYRPLKCIRRRRDTE